MQIKRQLTFSLACVVLLCLSGRAFSCVSPTPGVFYKRAKLVDESERIYVVELQESVRVKSLLTRYVLRVTSTLKGEPEESIEIEGYSESHLSTTFLNHTNPLFWLFDIGRSKWPPAKCGPDHTFKEGSRYIVYPDLLGARKSAEIISTDEDYWYKYILGRIKMNEK